MVLQTNSRTIIQSIPSVIFSSDPGAGEGIWFSLRGVAYQNNSLVTLQDIGEGGDALFCVTDLTACCLYYTDVNGFAVGNWYFPNGTRVPSSGNKWDFHRTRGQMVVLLHRRRSGENGIYHCVIPDATNVTQTVYIGVYTASAGMCKCNLKQFKVDMNVCIVFRIHNMLIII